MGCRSDYMEPTNKEKQLQETAILLLYVAKKLNLSKLATDAVLNKAAADIYCREDYVPTLCAILSKLSTVDTDRIVYNAKDKTSRRLADWWERHVKADNERKQAAAQAVKDAEIKKRALSKLTPEEIRVLRLKDK